MHANFHQKIGQNYFLLYKQQCNCCKCLHFYFILLSAIGDVKNQKSNNNTQKKKPKKTCKVSAVLYGTSHVSEMLQ